MITFAVVPILVQAGTSVVGAIFASAGAFLTILLRPFQSARGNLWKSFALALCGFALLFLATGGMRAVFRARRSHQTDWAQVAINLIRSEQLTNGAQFPTADGPTHLRSVWEFKLPGASFLSTPAVRDGRVYGASCTVDVGGTFGSVLCLDAVTGRKIWQVEKIGD